MIYGGVSFKHKPAPLNFSRPIKDANLLLTALKAREKRSLQTSQSSSETAPTSPLFSVSSAHFQKSAQVIENTRQTYPRNPIHFNQFRTPHHSFPVSPLNSAFYELHTGGVGYAGNGIKTAPRRTPRSAPRNLMLSMACGSTLRLARLVLTHTASSLPNASPLATTRSPLESLSLNRVLASQIMARPFSERA